MNGSKRNFFLHNFVVYYFSAVKPPLITEEPPKWLAFRVGEAIDMPCIATGQPEPKLVNYKDLLVKTTRSIIV